MAGHVAADDRAVEHVQRGEQRRRAVALVVVGHGAGAFLLQGQAWLCSVEGLDLVSTGTGSGPLIGFQKAYSTPINTPVRMCQTRMHRPPRESPIGIFR
jgi:hypothetical protein